jgi:hypothetical protein
VGRAEPCTSSASREHHSEALSGIDASNLDNALAIAEGGRAARVRYLGKFPHYRGGNTQAR